MLSQVAFCALILTVLVGCSSSSGDGQDGSPALNPPLPSPDIALGSFVDISATTGMNFIYGMKSPTGSDPEWFAGGVAAGDVNGDGFIDLFVVQGDVGENKLYINLGDNQFVDRAQEYGLAYTNGGAGAFRHSGPIFADIDGDGDLDLFIGAIEGDPVKLYRNDGVSFTDITESSGLGTMQAPYTIGAAFGDYDLDGDLDLALAHWGTERPVPVEGGVADTETIWRNDSQEGAIKFTNVSLESGLAENIIVGNKGQLDRNGKGPFDYSFTPTFARMDDDLYPDLLMVADYQNTRIFQTLQDEGVTRFQDVTNAQVIRDENGMGSAVADWDNDGDLDWFVTGIWARFELVGNRFYRNDGDFIFSDITVASSVREGGWGWAACAADFNLDGLLDIYHTNGWKNIPSSAGLVDDFQNDSDRLYIQLKPGVFANLASSFGLISKYEGRGVVCSDFDGDGDVDIFVVTRDFPRAFMFWRNDVTAQSHLKVKLIGAAPNTEAANARIYVTTAETTQMREIMIGNNYVSQNPTDQIFGLGKLTSADKLKIEWPTGVTESYFDVPSGSHEYTQPSP